MKYLLDTDTCVGVIRAREPVSSRVAACSPDDLVISSMTEAELRFGALNSSAPQHNLAITEAFLSGFSHPLPFDSDAARAHADIRFALRAQRIGENDLVIASIAISRSLSLVTGNVREFSRVPNLNFENWMIP